jgi:hypothetical protein
VFVNPFLCDGAGATGRAGAIQNVGKRCVAMHSGQVVVSASVICAGKEGHGSDVWCNEPTPLIRVHVCALQTQGSCASSPTSTIKLFSSIA